MNNYSGNHVIIMWKKQKISIIIITSTKYANLIVLLNWLIVSQSMQENETILNKQ